MVTIKKRWWIEILLHLVFWAGVFYVLTSLNSSHIHVATRGPRIMMRDQFEETYISSYVYVIVLFLAMLFYSNIFWLFRKVIRNKNSLIRVGICAVWFALIFSANYFIAGPMFNKENPTPLPPPGPSAFVVKRDIEIRDTVRRKALDRLANTDAVNFTISDWLHIQPVILLAFLVIQGIAIAYFFLKEWTKSELIQSQLQANQLSTEIKFLKSQINPHFLFNTLNNLFSMAQSKGNDELADGISKLSGMMRYMLYDSNEEIVPLEKEIIYLEECITLNKLRYADEEVEVIFEQSGQIAGTRIAPMLFIPFVENAFKYGVAIGQKAILQITLAVSNQKLIFTCENTDYSAVKKMEMEISGIGLENVQRRLALVYPGKHRLNIIKAEGKFKVNLEIDLS
ncbi:MAG: sensor histidine kinase [Chitinophagaceae bacterium]